MIKELTEEDKVKVFIQVLLKSVKISSIYDIKNHCFSVLMINDLDIQSSKILNDICDKYGFLWSFEEFSDKDYLVLFFWVANNNEDKKNDKKN